jgi:hypothetical protein
MNTKFRSLLLGIGAVGVVTFGPGQARASEEFPAAIQEAAGIPCVPGCTLCHGQAKGDAGSFRNKKLGATLFAINGAPVPPHDTNALKAAFLKYSMDPANTTNVANLKAGIDPETLDGICGPTYGCGAHVAKKAPPSDLSAPLWVVGAMLLGGLLRRRKHEA